MFVGKGSFDVGREERQSLLWDAGSPTVGDDPGIFKERVHKPSFWGRNSVFWGKMQTSIFGGGSPKVWGMPLRPPLVGTESVGGLQQPPAGLETPPPPACFQEQLGPAWVVLLGSW